MKQFIKKPITVEATQLIDNNFRSLDDVPLSIAGKGKVGNDEYGFYVAIPTSEGDVKARNNDWIIKLPSGEFYTCKPDIFKKNYQEVGEE
ncbi:MAG TPA: hypothetical protein PKC87_00890 [Candidatus Absconditabacterales bacterium]|nr:hypothetical protein [Candidatus Absconditabacterales bacterium]